MSRVFDPGLQPERTELSWRRTALTIAVGSLVAMRLIPAALGSTIWMVPGMLGVLAAGVVWLASRSRMRRVSAMLLRDERSTLPGAGLLLCMAVLATAIGAMGVIIVLMQL